MSKQYSIKVCLKRFVGKGRHSMNSYLEQIHHMETFEPLDANKLTNKYKSESLESLMLLTEKRSGRIKGRTCAFGRK